MKVHQLIKLLANCHPNSDVFIRSANPQSGVNETDICDCFVSTPDHVVLASDVQTYGDNIANVEPETIVV